MSPLVICSPGTSISMSQSNDASALDRSLYNGNKRPFSGNPGGFFMTQSPYLSLSAWFINPQTLAGRASFFLSPSLDFNAFGVLTTFSAEFGRYEINFTGTKNQSARKNGI